MRTTTVHACLLEVKSAAGAEFAPTVANLTVCLVMLIGPNLFWWPLVSYFLQKLLQWMFRKDPHLSLIFTRYMREGDHYDPWPRANQYVNKRPFGAGRDLLC
jgi:type IV secretory pathway TrbD component